MSKRSFFWILGGLVAFVLSCVSRTQQDLRFQESESMNSPTFSVSLADDNQFSFAMVGDLHVAAKDTARLARIVDAAEAENDSFLILLGDIADTGHEDDFQAVKSVLTDKNWQDKTLWIVGNHDIFEAGWDSFKKHFGPSHFEWKIGNSTFVAVDSADGTLGEPQTEWLKQKLSEKSTQHLFVLSHYLPVIPAQRTYLRISNEEEAEKLMKWSTNSSVTAWLGGHYHSFVTDTIAGVQYVVAGGGGGRRMQPVNQNFFVQAQVKPSEVTYHLKIVD